MIALSTLASVGAWRGARAVLAAQAALARQRIGKPLGEDAVPADRVWRRGLGGEPISLLVLGDSLAAGLGAQRRKHTLGARLAKGLAGHVHRPVRLITGAIVGSESVALAGQLDAVGGDIEADIAVIVVGGNDVTHLIPTRESVAHLVDAIRRLHAVGTRVVVGTCPDLGALRPVPQPLRTLVGHRSAHLAAAQRRAVQGEGAIAVDLRRTVGPVFRAQPEDMFSLDQFHPSAAGYRHTAQALVPALVQALRTPALRGRVPAQVQAEHPQQQTDSDDADADQYRVPRQG